MSLSWIPSTIGKQAIMSLFLFLTLSINTVLYDKLFDKMRREHLSKKTSLFFSLIFPECARWETLCFLRVPQVRGWERVDSRTRLVYPLPAKPEQILRNTHAVPFQVFFLSVPIINFVLLFYQLYRLAKGALKKICILSYKFS